MDYTRLNAKPNLHAKCSGILYFHFCQKITPNTLNTEIFNWFYFHQNFIFVVSMISHPKLRHDFQSSLKIIIKNIFKRICILCQYPYLIFMEVSSCRETEDEKYNGISMFKLSTICFLIACGGIISNKCILLWGRNYVLEQLHQYLGWLTDGLKNVLLFLYFMLH